jgi:hypothetical protein
VPSQSPITYMFIGIKKTRHWSIREILNLFMQYTG